DCVVPVGELQHGRDEKRLRDPDPDGQVDDRTGGSLEKAEDRRDHAHLRGKQVGAGNVIAVGIGDHRGHARLSVAASAATAFAAALDRLSRQNAGMSTRYLRCTRLATSPVHPVWCIAPRPRPVSPWKYSWNSSRSRHAGSRWKGPPSGSAGTRPLRSRRNMSTSRSDSRLAISF